MVRHTPILALAPNGAYRQKSDHPELPLYLDEIVQIADDAQHAGATLLHLHIRDQNNQHSLDADTYRRTIDAIQDRIDDKLIIQITSEAANRYSPAQQIASIKAVNPDCVSVSLRELMPNSASLPAAQDLFHWCAEKRCRAQIILYNENELLSYFAYRRRDVIPAAPHSVLFVLGRYTRNQASTREDLPPFLKHIDQLEVPWMVCAFGATEQSCLLDAASKGGHIRIGFENNLLNADGQIAESNIEQLRDIARKVSNASFKLAGIQEARRLLSIR